MNARILLALVFIMVFVSTVNGEISNNTSHIYNNSSLNNDSYNSSYNRTDKVIIEDNTNTKSKITIKIYRQPKKASGFEAITIIPIIMIIYILKTKRDIRKSTLR